MNIIVCVKRVPLTQEVDLVIDDTGKKIREEALAYVINDWDNYAIEAAIQLQENLGGEVTAVNIGHEDDEEVLRRALAMGADRAIRIDPGDLTGRRTHRQDIGKSHRRSGLRPGSHRGPVR
jgi:electron transfer flavoprotein beta subunit